MVVYEATTRRDYKKIADFLQKQPSGSVVMRCWGKDRERTTNSLESEKKANPYLDIYVTEDDKGNIRLVWSRERRGFSGLNEPKMAVNDSMCMSHEDFANQNFTYLVEFWRWILKENLRLGLVAVEVWGLERFVLLLKEHIGDAMEILRTEEAPHVGKVCFVRIDLKKLL